MCPGVAIAHFLKNFACFFLKNEASSVLSFVALWVSYANQGFEYGGFFFVSYLCSGKNEC